MKAIKIIVKWMSIFITAFLSGMLTYIVINVNDFRDFLPVTSGAYAKFMCVSMFVLGMTEEQARSWSHLPLPYQKMRIDYKTKTVSVTAWGVTSVARYIDERHGTVLE